MKLILLLILFFKIGVVFGEENKKILQELSKLKKQTVLIHNDILENNDELKKIKIDIKKNKQKRMIFENHIKDKNNVSRRLFFLLQDKIYISPVNKFVKNLTTKSDDIISKQIIREFFLKQAKLNINQYLVSIDGIEELKIELDKKFIIFEKKKRLK